ncbi:hypothetical protein BU25DRAFT_410874 [Macroventuria anomochaeta]|uniref:Uncharacterized protein n=1 Tax=Macroventuria anomochaeta TaxID=301207 RepID=A0ACB6RZW8_9PLEO|nr:uncharacterized protein BU25DRAFT_410874 [Macroventuria anomochaeta]KAF2627257.1 hypothetical protein BU25DRAFT_410874 [Macroventuria anomochaeta]
MSRISPNINLETTGTWAWRASEPPSIIHPAPSTDVIYIIQELMGVIGHLWGPVQLAASEDCKGSARRMPVDLVTIGGIETPWNIQTLSELNLSASAQCIHQYCPRKTFSPWHVCLENQALCSLGPHWSASSTMYCGLEGETALHIVESLEWSEQTSGRIWGIQRLKRVWLRKSQSF